MQCEAEVYPRFNFFKKKKLRQCNNRATISHNGHCYCDKHDPEKVEVREYKKRQKLIND